MNEEFEGASLDATLDEPTNVTRRSMLLGLGAAAGAAAGAGLLTSQTFASVPQTHFAPVAGTHPSGPHRPEAVGAAIPGLTYVGYDAQQFWPSIAAQRVYQDITGSQGNANDRIWTGLHLPAGSVIRQINVGYQVQPIVEISRRLITQPNPATAPTQVFQKSLLISPGGPFSSSENLPTPVTIMADSTYTLSFFLGAGSSVFGATVGYTPPTQGFFPFIGTTPRVLDTRLPGPLTGKLNPGEERIVDLGTVGPRTAIINLTVTDTVNGGFVAVFAADVPYPNNSSVNWTATGENVANGVITAMDATGKIKIRGGASPTHVVIDRIGFMQ